MLCKLVSMEESKGLMPLTALEIRNVVGPGNMIARPWNGAIPQSRHRRALQENQDHLINIDDDVTDSDKVKAPHE